VTDTREIYSSFQHVLPRQPHLQSSRPQTLVDRPHEEHDDVTVIAGREPRRETHRNVGILILMDARKNAEPVSPLGANVLQRLLERPLLSV